MTLLPIGGISHLERLADRAGDEIVIALAGPAVNAVLAGLSMAVYVVWPQPMVERWMWLNVALGLFNLLPAFPMDGGRVLRGLLWLRMDYVTATRRAARVGRGMALLFVALGLEYNLILLLIGVFVMLAATAEEQYVTLRDTCSRMNCREAADDRWLAVQPHDAVTDVAARLLLRGDERALVLRDGHAVGFLTARDVARGTALQVLDVMRPLATVQATAPLTEALQLLADREAVCVVNGEQPAGVITERTLSRTLILQSALRPAGHAIQPHHVQAEPQVSVSRSVT